MEKNLTPSHSILFTGGGTAGHVTPNLALINRVLADGWKVVYVGSYQGIEKEIIGRINLPYYGISTAKLRRYLSWQNLLTPFKVIQGIFQAYFLCRRLKPQIVFSKGGFVAFPVVFAAWLNRIPVVAHESDLTPGLANRLSFPFVQKICVTFPEGKKFFRQQEKVIVTGTPIRPELFTGQADKGRKLCGFNENKPVLMILGGGLGSDIINRSIRKILPQLLQQFQIVHLCGKGKTDPAFAQQPGYKQFEYLNEDLADVFACTDFVISRAGANTIYELLALKKPHILIPLSKKSSRGDQIANAENFAAKGISLVVTDEELQHADKLESTISNLLQQRTAIMDKIDHLSLPNSITLIYDQLTALAKS